MWKYARSSPRAQLFHARRDLVERMDLVVLRRVCFIEVGGDRLAVEQHRRRIDDSASDQLLDLFRADRLFLQRDKPLHAPRPGPERLCQTHVIAGLKQLHAQRAPIADRAHRMLPLHAEPRGLIRQMVIVKACVGVAFDDREEPALAVAAPERQDALRAAHARGQERMQLVRAVVRDEHALHHRHGRKAARALLSADVERLRPADLLYLAVRLPQRDQLEEHLARLLQHLDLQKDLERVPLFLRPEAAEAHARRASGAAVPAHGAPLLCGGKRHALALHVYKIRTEFRPRGVASERRLQPDVHRLRIEPHTDLASKFNLFHICSFLKESGQRKTRSCFLCPFRMFDSV